jgi:hypothetical protein
MACSLPKFSEVEQGLSVFLVLPIELLYCGGEYRILFLSRRFHWILFSYPYITAWRKKLFSALRLDIQFLLTEIPFLVKMHGKIAQV